MEDGFLDNIIALFRKDESLFPLIGDMLGDERVRVRLGTIALIETLTEENPRRVKAAIPGIADCLNSPAATIRGDAAHALGIIGDKDALPLLSKAAEDKNEMVRNAVKESIETINGS